MFNFKKKEEKRGEGNNENGKINEESMKIF